MLMLLEWIVIQHWCLKTENKGKTNLEKGDTTLLSYSPGGSTYHIVCPGECIWNLHNGGIEVTGGQRLYHLKEQWWFPIGSPMALSLTIAIVCLQCSNQQGWVNLQHNLERKEMTDVKQILKWSERNMGLSYAKEIVSVSSANWAQCKRQRQTDDKTVTSIPICISSIFSSALVLCESMEANVSLCLSIGISV